MIGILFATKTEALPFLNSVGVHLVKSSPFLLFKPLKCNEKVLPCSIIISGIGKVAAAVATAELILKHSVNFIINAGICGALNSDLPSVMGSVYKISSATEGDRNLGSKDHVQLFKCASFFTGLEEARLVTCDKAIFDDNLKHKYSFIADLVDMEGAAVVRVANIYNIKCDLIKGVSDLANSGGIKTMASNIKQVSVSLSKTLLYAISIRSLLN